MATGRTPTLKIVSSGVGTLTLEDVTTPHPFPTIGVERKYEDRYTRESTSGAAKLKRIFRRYSEADLQIPVTVPFLSGAQYILLRGMVQKDVPEVVVTYLHLTDIKFDLVNLSPAPDDFWWDLEQTFATSFTLKGKSQ
jgi:hypothetical protein